VANSGLRLNLLGPPTLVSGNDPVALSPGAAMLVAYLALAPREGRQRSVAAAQLFADSSSDSARRRLNTALWRLQSEVRASTGVELVGRSGGRSVALSPAVDMTVDAIRFERLLEPVLRRSVVDLTDDDVLAFSCTAEDKEAMVGDDESPWFTTPHWNGYNAVLLLERDLARLTAQEIREVVTDAWLTKAPKRVAKEFLGGA
jgi:hypothetical protein